ncbi:trans-sulfuration enzyme family protein, partial [Lachnotalea glycerini]
PLDMGIDIVMHTMTKYIGGHSDLIGGVLISKDEEFMRKIMVQRDWFGGVIGPMEAWLAIRGLRTLDVRMQRHYETTMEIAKFLENHPKIKRVFYTGLPSHPQYELARKQQSGECGLLSVEVEGDVQDVETFVDSLKLFSKGCSWGGFESLAIAYTYNWSEKELEFHHLSKNIVRLHCGLEGSENLLQDLKQALNKI